MTPIPSRVVLLRDLLVGVVFLAVMFAVLGLTMHLPMLFLVATTVVAASVLAASVLAARVGPTALTDTSSPTLAEG